MAGRTTTLAGLRRAVSACETALGDEYDTPGSNIAGYQLADRIVDYCVKNRLPDPYTTVIVVDYLGIKQYGAWRSPRAEAYFAEQIAARQPPKDDEKQEDSVWQKPGTLPFQQAAGNLLASKFQLSEKDDGVFQLYRIENWDTMTVVPVVGSDRDTGIVVSRACVTELAREGIAATGPRVGAMLTAFYATAVAVSPPALLGQPGETNWCLHRRTIEPDTSVAFPNIQMFLDRLSDPEAYSAWWWGVLSGRNKGRQSLYIYDRDGQGGKSKITHAKAKRLFGDRIYAAFPSGANTNDAHTSSHFVGKKIVTLGDNKNTFVLHSGFFKQLLGDDPSFVNPKYVQPFTTCFEARVIVLGNVAPFILRQAHSTSRILYLTLDKLDLRDDEIDTRYAEKCVAELPGFLAHAQQCYERLCPNDYAIQTNERVKRATALRIAECETMFSVPFDEWFVADPEGSLTFKEWAKVMKELRFDQNRSEDFLQWIKILHAAEQQLYGARRIGWELLGVRLRRPSDRRREDAAEARRQPHYDDQHGMMGGVE